MSFPDAPKCDTCGVMRQECNHWWTSEPEANGGWILMPYSETEKLGYIRDEQVKVHCSQVCVHKRVDEYMSDYTARQKTEAATEVTA